MDLYNEHKANCDSFPDHIDPMEFDSQPTKNQINEALKEALGHSAINLGENR